MCNFFIRYNKNPRFMDKTKKKLDTLPFSPWAILATWLHLETPQNYKKNELITRKIK